MTQATEHELRHEKCQQWKEGGAAYPNQYRPTHQAASLKADYPDAASLPETTLKFALCGRIRLCRRMGKASFMHLQDHTGQCQLYFRQQDLGEALYEASKQLDLGDIIYASGHLFFTKMGELSLYVETFALLSKSLHPMPEKFHGLHEAELRHRQRYLDIMTNDETRHVFALRSQLLHHLRAFLVEESFMEVETPMMHVIPGGAAARPFSTHHHALDLPLYLRVAPELFLKRLIVAGYDRVFELNRNFRNEGLSTRHNPEFTMVEFYQAYADYETMMDLTERLLCHLADTLLGRRVCRYQDHDIHFDAPFTRLSMAESVLAKHPSLSQACLRNAEKMKAYLADQGVSCDEKDPDLMMVALFEKTVEPSLIQPTFITDYPIAVSPLARRQDKDPSRADRFELFIGGQEVANGFSELNDPEDQAMRMREQVLRHEAGDQEAMYFDQDYVTALEYGMPPTAGEGIGIDRLMMIFANQASIREVILFPLLRPKTA